MKIDPMIEIGVRNTLRVDYTNLSVKKKLALQRGIQELALEAGGRYLEPGKPSGLRNPPTSLMTTQELFASLPYRRFAGQNEMSERQRGIFTYAREVSLPYLDYAGAWEYENQHLKSDEVVQVFFLWSREIYEPKRRIQDAVVNSAIDSACDLVAPLLDQCSHENISPESLRDAVPHGFKLQRIRWLQRETGAFRSGIFVGLQESGIGVRADGLANICRFFVGPSIREAVHDDKWLLVGPKQAALVIRSKTQLSDFRGETKARWVSGNIGRDTGIPENPDILAYHKAARKFR